MRQSRSEHVLNSARDVGLAATGHVTALCKRSGYLRRDMPPLLNSFARATIGPTATAFACSGLLTVTRGVMQTRRYVITDRGAALRAAQSLPSGAQSI